MKAQELRNLTDAELQKKLGDLKAELFNLRFSHATNSLTNPLILNVCKKNIATVKTIIRERELGIAKVEKVATAIKKTAVKTAEKTVAKKAEHKKTTASAEKKAEPKKATVENKSAAKKPATKKVTASAEKKAEPKKAAATTEKKPAAKKPATKKA